MARLGKHYNEGEVIFRQGEAGNCMFVIQKGEVEAVAEAEADINAGMAKDIN